MTAIEERKAKDAARAKRSKVYRFEPVLFDRLNPPRREIDPGTLVVKIQPHGCPKNGIMGMCYIGDKDSGDFIGMVMESSLMPAKR